MRYKSSVPSGIGARIPALAIDYIDQVGGVGYGTVVSTEGGGGGGGGGAEGVVTCTSTHLGPSFWPTDDGGFTMPWDSALGYWADTGEAPRNGLNNSSKYWNYYAGSAWGTGYRPTALIMTINGGNGVADDGTDPDVVFPMITDIIVRDTSNVIIGTAAVLHTAPNQDVSVAVELTFGSADIGLVNVIFDYYRYNKSIKCIQFTEEAVTSDPETEFVAVSIHGSSFWLGATETEGTGVIGYDPETEEPIYGPVTYYWPDAVTGALFSSPYAPVDPIDSMTWNVTGSWTVGYRPVYIEMYVTSNALPETSEVTVSIYSGEDLLGSATQSQPPSITGYNMNRQLYVELDFTGAGDITHLTVAELNPTAGATQYFILGVKAYETI